MSNEGEVEPDEVEALVQVARTSPLIDIISGSIGGMASVVVGQPFDVVKVRQQMGIGGKTLKSVVSKTWRIEGLRGFFKGMSPPLVAETLYNCIYFGAYGFAQRQLQPDPTQRMTIPQCALAGSFAGMVCSTAISPVDLIKVRLQINQEVGTARKTSMGIMKDVWKTEGLKGFYRGYSSVFGRESSAMGVYFGSYEYLKSRARRADGTIPIGLMLLSGGTAGILTWVCNYPIDVIKTQLQSSTEHSTIVGAARHIWKHEGLPGFYRGIVPCVARAFPVNATVFGVYEFVAEILNERARKRSA